METFTKSGDTVVIEYLCRHPEYIKTIAQWNYEEFIRNTPRTADFNRVMAHFSSSSELVFPITFIAVDSEACIGTVSIVHNDLKIQSELTPWLSSLYVRPDRRSQGIAKLLIAQARHAAKELGFDFLYLRTEQASDYYRRLGWEFVLHTTDEYSIETDVFKINL